MHLSACPHVDRVWLALSTVRHPLFRSTESLRPADAARWQVFYYIFFSVCTLTVLFMVIRPYFRKAKPKTAAEAIALR